MTVASPEPKIEPFAQRLRRLLKARGMTQAALAEVARLKAYQVNRVVTGRRRPTLYLVECIARGLDLPLHELVAGSDAEEFVAEERRVVSRQDYERVLADLVTAQTELAQLRDSVADLTRAEADARRHAEEEREQRMVTVRTLDRLHREHDELRGRIGESQARRRELEGENRELHSQVRVLRGVNQLLRTQVARATSAHDTLVERYRTLYAHYQQLAAESGSSGGEQAGAAILGGLLGLGLGALLGAAASDS